MTHMVIVGRGGIIDADRVVAIVPARSVPVKRMLRALDPSRVINMTYGFPRGAVLVLDNGSFAIVSQTVEQITQDLSIEERLSDAENPISR